MSYGPQKSNVSPSTVSVQSSRSDAPGSRSWIQSGTHVEYANQHNTASTTDSSHQAAFPSNDSGIADTRRNLPRGFGILPYCVPCNRRDAAAINGVCTMAGSH